MNAVLRVVCFLVSCGVTFGWYNKAEDEVYGGWVPSRRSTHCVVSGGQCMKTYQCCNEWDICYVTSQTGQSYGRLSPYGECKNMMKVYEGYYPKAAKGYKKHGEPCKSSLECADQCCRVRHIGRLGVERSCGKPGFYACVGNKNPNEY